MIREDAELLLNQPLRGDYFTAEFRAAGICPMVFPGQFIHVKIPDSPDQVLRRPFSIHDVDESGVLRIVYKVVGEGTARLSRTRTGTMVDIMGPLGRGFSMPRPGETPVIVAGGYGSAATYLVARRSPAPGFLLYGARTADDVIITERYERLGFRVEVATNDGGMGKKGLVTELMKPILEGGIVNPRFYGCGPLPMLMAMGSMLLAHGFDGELSLDHLMCCGVGACFACVIKVKADNEQGWRYARTCKDGPVFEARDIYFS